MPFDSPAPFQCQMQGMTLLPPLRTVLVSRIPQNLYNLNLKAQAQLQTKQIDSAIQLLKMQYDAIMSTVEKSNCSPCDDTSAHIHSSETSATKDQTSFAAQFELPGPEFVGEQLGLSAASTFAMRASSPKRSLKTMLSTGSANSKSSKDMSPPDAKRSKRLVA